MRYIQFLCIPLFFFYHLGMSQSQITIQGVVVDSVNNETLFSASVALLRASDSSLVKGVVSDDKGFFRLSNVSQGSYILRISYVGYNMFYKMLNVSSQHKNIIVDTIRMRSLSNVLGGVVITDTKPIYSFDGEKMVYNVSEDPDIQTLTLSDALQNAPSVEVDIEGNITLRGVSSVEIWINNKPSKLNAENLKTYIQQMPANVLDKIEVISNPSAKYAAEGTGGIINIVTVSKIKMNSFISFGINASTLPMASPWLSYMWANEKFSINIYLNGNYSYNKSKGNGYNVLFDDNKDTASYQTYNNENKNNSYSGSSFLNISYNIDTMNSISFWGNVYGGYYNSFSTRELYRREYAIVDSEYKYSTFSDNQSNSYNMSGNVMYQCKFNNSGHYLRTNLGANMYNSLQNGCYERDYLTQNELDKTTLSTDKDKNYGLDAKIDYSYPYSKNGELSLGISDDFGRNTGLFYEDTLLPGTQSYLLDSVKYRDYIGVSNSLETYASLRHQFGDFTVNVGLRFQYKQIDYQMINSPKDNIKQNYPGLFPSFHASYRTKSMHNFRISYTRRIAYPGANQLSSFMIYGDESFSTGNPFLEPTYTHSMDGGWSKFFKKMGDVGISSYFRYTKNEINSLTDVVFSDFYGRVVNYSVPVNSGSGYQTGGEFRFNYRLKSYMNIRFYSNVYFSHAKTMFDYSETSLRSDTLIVTESFSYSFRLNYWAKLFKFLTVNLSANYRSPTKSLYVENQATYSINCGMRADFFKRKLSVFVNVRDIFNWNKREYNTNSVYYKAYNTTKYDSRFVSAGFTLRFGKIELENRAKSGMEE